MHLPVSEANLVAFFSLALLLTLTPGADTLLTIKNSIHHGRKTGAATALGVCAGLFVHATLSALGASAILLASATAYAALKLCGAAYLAYLGLRALREALHPVESANTACEARPSRTFSPLAAMRQGFFCNILNPKVAVFYLAFLPQFVQPGDPVLAAFCFLAAVHFLQGILWLVLVAVCVGSFRAFLARPAVRRLLDGCCGAVFLTFGLKLALSRAN